MKNLFYKSSDKKPALDGSLGVHVWDRHGVLLITGLGRTGLSFGCKQWSARAHIVVMPKGLGAGYMPFDAVIADKKIVTPIMDQGGFEHRFTYAGNPLTCAADLVVGEEVETPGLCANATLIDLGQYIHRQLKAA